MRPVPVRALRIDGRVPALHELLDARHVDRAVVEVVLDVGQVGGEEAAVGADRVAAQRDRARLGHVLLDELERRCPASSSVIVEAWIASSRPDRVCMSTTNGSILASTSSGWWITRSGPSATIVSSSSVTIVAISTMTSDVWSSPVISRSIHTSTVPS